MRRFSFIAPLIFILLTMGMTTCCTTLGENDIILPTRGPAVHITAKPQPYAEQRGTGVVIHSSAARGTFVLTNTHVVVFRPFSDMSRIIEVRLEDGTELEGGALYAVMSPFNTADGKTIWLDCTIVWIPPVPESMGIDAVEVDMVPPELGDYIEVHTFAPGAKVKIITGQITTDGPMGPRVLLDEDVVSGNSGSAVLDKDGELIGIIWGRGGGTSKNNIGSYVPISLLRPFFAERPDASGKSLDWLLD